MRASMTSLQVCRLVELVTSRNNSLVVWLIYKQQNHTLTNQSKISKCRFFMPMFLCASMDRTVQTDKQVLSEDEM